MKHEVIVELAGGKHIKFETGRMAKQASGAAFTTSGDNAVLATAVASPDPKEGIDFFPLTVEYREFTYAGGRIPGGFIKREGRPSEKEVLTSRQIDRPIRPLFPEAFRNETQVVAFVYSADKENDPDVLGINGASCALALSDIPFHGPVGAVRVGMIDGNFVVNPTYTERALSAINIMVVGTADGIVMVESGAKEISEENVVGAIEFAHIEIKKICAAIEELVKLAGKPKREVKEVEIDQLYLDGLYNKVGGQLKDALDTQKHPKFESYAMVKEIKDALKKELPEGDAAAAKKFSKYYELMRENIFRDQVLNDRIRPDHRAFDQIRHVSVEIGVLPRVHGSALFTRGETQALVTATLGTTDDAQRMESYEGEQKRKFMLHYNFPPFSVGEVGRMTGVGRREIGHGALAWRAIEAVLPGEDESPYTLRVVSDILESNGSSSMATVCGASLALMAAGIPIKGAVAGVAMGLVKEGDNYAVLTDIAGAEDHYGDMDFKVAGTRKGITALQMDIKIMGITAQIMREALEQARRGRLELLDTMDATISSASEAEERVCTSDSHHDDSDGQDPRPDRAGRQGDPRDHRCDRREDRRRRHWPRQCGFERRRWTGSRYPDDHRPHGDAGDRQDLPGQGGSSGGVRRVRRDLPRHRWPAARLRDRRAPRQGSQGRAARGRSDPGEGAVDRRQPHQAVAQGCTPRAAREARSAAGA